MRIRSTLKRRRLLWLLAPLLGPSCSAPTETSLRPPPQVAIQRKPDPIAEIVHAMTIEAKAAQVLVGVVEGRTLSSTERERFAETAPGGVILLKRNVASAEQVRSLSATLQATVADSGIRAFVAVDQEGGAVQRIRDGVPRSPSPRKLAQAPQKLERLAQETATGLLTQGVNLVFAPNCDVVADRRSFLYWRSFGSEPEAVAAHSVAIIRAFDAQGLIAVAKHFPGHGAASADTHRRSATAGATIAEFESRHLPPFRSAIEEGVDAIMVSHVIPAAYDAANPASSSKAVIEGLLRYQLGFRGVVVSDDLRMRGVRGLARRTSAETCAVRMLRAGCDLIIDTGTPVEHRKVAASIVKAVEKGWLSASRLDEAVQRILKLKEKRGLLDLETALTFGRGGSGPVAAPFPPRDASPPGAPGG